MVNTWKTTSAAIFVLAGSLLLAAPSDGSTGGVAEGPRPLDPPGCWDADGIWHPDCWGPGQWAPGQYGPGQYGPGQYGPGQYGPGQWGPGMMGPGQWGPGMGPGMMAPGPWGY